MLRRDLLLASALTLTACGSERAIFTPTDAAVVDTGPARDVVTPPADLGGGGTDDVVFTTDVPPVTRDVSERDVPVFTPDAACTSVAVEAQVERQPVDIIWMVDNSTSMAPAVDQVIRGLNNFAQLIGQRGLDYRVVMLSIRNRTRNVTVGGSGRYAVCIPQPLAGNDACGDGPRFRHSSIDIRSTQPLEQMLGSLAQTRGYTATDERGGEPWADFLRADATKTLVVVTDDNSRFSAEEFEHFRGGTNPRSSSFTLPPGVLDPSWNGLFTGYTFTGIYGWGSATNPATRCTFMNGGVMPTSSGPVYTSLVERTNGVRAQICAAATEWDSFFTQIATAVDRSSGIACDLALPTPPSGTELDPRRVNVSIRGTATTRLGRVLGPSACGPIGGWHYDNEQQPTRVVLCPASCESAQQMVRAGGARVEVAFGCLSIPG